MRIIWETVKLPKVPPGSVQQYFLNPKPPSSIPSKPTPCCPGACQTPLDTNHGILKGFLFGFPEGIYKGCIQVQDGGSTKVGYKFKKGLASGVHLLDHGTL